MTMNKKDLNNEIILCRPAVRRAKVIVIRKLLKKMKILKSCKIESAKEKKLKKSERVFKKVQIMKKVKDDDVTKFALRNSNLESYLHGPKVLLKENALACLARHEAVARRVNSIRERIQNWETELPILLDSLGKKKHSAKRCDAVKGADKIKIQSVEKRKCEGNLATDAHKKSQLCQAEASVKPVIKTSILRNSAKNETQQKVRHKDDDNPARGVSSNSEKPQKIDDPFFIDKKVIQPKLLLESLSVRKSNKELEKLKQENGISMNHKKPFKVKKESIPFRAEKPKSLALDQLHPSWAAKKVTLIKPFEGKKIVFSEE